MIRVEYLQLPLFIIRADYRNQYTHSDMPLLIQYFSSQFSLPLQALFTVAGAC